MMAYADTIADAALHGGILPAADLQQCYENANLVEGKVIWTSWIYIHASNIFQTFIHIYTRIDIHICVYLNMRRIANLNILLIHLTILILIYIVRSWLSD